MNENLALFLDKIEHLQSCGNLTFPEGVFPAYRTNRLIGYRRPDTTIFFSSIICFTLQNFREKLEPALRLKVDDICQKVIANYPDFQNKDGLKTYNFWKTKPSRHFPNGYLFRHFDHFRIPDDIDDTAFVYMTIQPSQDELNWLKTKLGQHANGIKHHIRNTYPEYRPLPAYSTWFGKNMYIEFDVSVLSNMLYCILKYNLPLNENDTASFEYIRSVISTDRYIREPFRCAHQYPRTSLIMYHVARLIGAFEPQPLESVRCKLSDDILTRLNNTTNPMDRVLLATSLMRLGVKTDRIAVEKYGRQDFHGFFFFIAGLLTAYEHSLLYRMSGIPLFHMYWVCEAHCWTLLAEYEVLWNSFE